MSGGNAHRIFLILSITAQNIPNYRSFGKIFVSNTLGEEEGDFQEFQGAEAGVRGSIFQKDDDVGFHGLAPPRGVGALLGFGLDGHAERLDFKQGGQ